MKKKFLAALAGLVLLAGNTFACIETVQPEYDLTVFEDVNNELISSVSVGDTLIAKVKVPTDLNNNGVLTLSLPATISVQVGEFDSDNGLNIDTIILEYKDKSGNWQVIRSMTNVNYTLKTNAPVPHFGLNTFDPAGYNAGDEVEMRVCISDDMYETYLNFTVEIDDNRRPV